MSTYHEMWQEIKKLTERETDLWIRQLDPPKGVRVMFKDVFVNDVDLLEALRFWKEELS